MSRPSISLGLLPVPGSAAASWPLYRSRMADFVRTPDTAVLVAFWLFGLINNVIYVIILSAAQDLVGDLPKGIVLLAGMSTPSLGLRKCAQPFRTRR
jgi:battenin